MQFIYLHLHLWNASSPPDHLLQTGPHLAHLCQVLHSVPTVSLQPPPALLQIRPLIPLLLQQILQLGEHQADWCDFFIYPWPGPQWSADLLTSSACSFSLAFSLVRRFTFSSSHCKSSMACCKNKTETCGSVEQMWCKFPAKNGSHLTGMLSFGRSQRKHDGLIKSDPERDIHSSLKWSKLKCKAHQHYAPWTKCSHIWRWFLMKVVNHRDELLLLDIWLMLLHTDRTVLWSAKEMVRGK